MSLDPLQKIILLKEKNMETLKKLRIFNGNTLKIIAAITMLIDHFGLMFYPENMALRAIGRIAMPLFAFMIAESARYTRNKIKHFAMMFGLGVICQIVYRIAMGESSMQLLNILITFSLSTLILYALDAFKTSLFRGNDKKALKRLPPLLTSFILLLTIVGAYIFCYYFTVDYDFWGVMMPVFANLLDFRAVKKKLGDDTPKWINHVDILPLRIACFAIGMLLFYLKTPLVLPSQYMFLTIPLLLLYNGERGKTNLKYFFYLFYPIHLVLLEVLWLLTQLR